MGQSPYFVRRHHDSVRMEGEFLDFDNAVNHAQRCVEGSANTADYEIVRVKDGVVVGHVLWNNTVRQGPIE